MMEKNSADHKVCWKCNKDALPGTEPPACQEHLLDKQASEEESKPSTLKELESKD